MALLLALDFGGTKLAAAAIHPGQRQWLRKAQQLSPQGADATADLALIGQLARQVLADATPAAVGVSFGGPIDAQTGVVYLSHHVPGWEKIALCERLCQQFAAPVAADNDANVAALGELRYGAGRGVESLFYVTVSTGVGGGWILAGRPWRGKGGLAGEIGHTVVDPNGPLCLCGKRGCVERLASGPYIAQDVRAYLAQHPEQPTCLRAFDPEKLTAAQVSEAAAAGDATAWQFLERGARALGTGLGNAANLIAPERILLGGGVTGAGERWWTAVREAARTVALPEIALDIQPAALGGDAPLWGALALAEDLLSERSPGVFDPKTRNNLI